MNDESEEKGGFTPKPRSLDGVRQTGALLDALKGITATPLTALNTSVTPPAEKVRRDVGTTQDLGRYVREKRIAMKLTQQELADTAGTGRRFISELEAGKATLEFGKVLQVCRSVGLDLFAAAR